MEEFIRADEEYNNTKLSILDRLEKHANLSESDMNDLLSNLSKSSDELMNAAIELTRSSLMEAKESAIAAGKIEYELLRIETKSPRRNRGTELQSELEISTKLTEMIKSVVEEYNEAKKKLDEMEQQRLLLEKSLSEIQDKQAEMDSLKDELTQVVAEIESKTLRIDQTQKEIDDLQNQYEATLSERDHNLKLKADIDTLIRNNKISISKLEDEAFLRKADIEKRISALNEILRLRNTVDEERLELKSNFTVDHVVEDWERQAVLDEIEGLKSEMTRLQKEIERIEELIFRKRVKY